MAHPSDKISRSKRGMRRSHDFLVKPAMATCPNCNSLIRPHRVCAECGHYKGKEVVAPRS
jgi:large subunit ribosomal protein L32